MVVKALLIAIFAALNASTELGMWVIQMQPLVSGAIVGLLLGDLKTAVIISGTIQLMYMGQIQVGGITAYDFTFAGVIAPAVAIVSHQTPEMAMTLALAIGTVGLISNNIYMTVNASFVHMADKYAEKGETKHLWIYAWLLPVLESVILYGVPAFLAVYFGAQYLEDIMNGLPQWLNNGLSAVGTLLPALGIAMMFKVVYNKKFIAFAILGYIFAAYFGLNMIGTALFAVACALLYWEVQKLSSSKTQEVLANDDDDD
ncbi:MAG: PTS sugar transporter subunit IIC [Erysipelotrichaceae bacterium]|nr:PTS sugar transporter subunit IIC [Erysipelotrichaceae bacterium]MDY6282290.1 PTS sugar transporter subunit IIC [Erysipelotrichaceae bacterium]